MPPETFAPAWPENARLSLGVFYRQLQEIEVYVEDENSEAFYKELLYTATNKEVMVKKVISLQGRDNVIDRCKTYNEEFPAIFIIDGDLNLLYGEKEPPIPRLFQHDMYCVENYIICPSACIEILMESSGTIGPDEAIMKLAWEHFVGSISEPLKSLFITFGAVWRLMPELKTVGHRFYKVCVQKTKSSGPTLCPQKIDELITELEASVIDTVGLEALEAEKLKVKSNFDASIDPFDLISGKDFLLPALFHYLGHIDVTKNQTLDSFKFRLARHCQTPKLERLGDAIKLTASGQVYSDVA